SGNVVLLEHNHRFAHGSEIAALADAIRKGDDDGAMVLLRSPHSGEVIFVETGQGAEAALGQQHEKAADNAVKVIRAALAADAEYGLETAAELKVLCATRFGPLGVSGWTSAIESLAKRRLPHAGIGGGGAAGPPPLCTP